MDNSFWCDTCKQLHTRCECPPASASACSAADGGTSGSGAPAEIRSVPPTGERTISERMDDLLNLAVRKRLYPEGTTVNQVLKAEAEKTASRLET